MKHVSSWQIFSFSKDKWPKPPERYKTSACQSVLRVYYDRDELWSWLLITRFLSRTSSSLTLHELQFLFNIISQDLRWARVSVKFCLSLTQNPLRSMNFGQLLQSVFFFLITDIFHFTTLILWEKLVLPLQLNHLPFPLSSHPISTPTERILGPNHPNCFF